MTLIGKIPAAQTDPEVFHGSAPVMRIAGKKVMLFQLIAFPAACSFLIGVLPLLGSFTTPLQLAVVPLVLGIIGLIASAVKHSDINTDTLPLTVFSVFFILLSALLLAAAVFFDQMDIDAGLFVSVFLPLAFAVFNPFLVIPALILWFSIDRMVRYAVMRRRCTVSAMASLYEEVKHEFPDAERSRHRRLVITGVSEKVSCIVYRYDTDSGSYYTGFAPGSERKGHIELCYDPEHPERCYATDSYPRIMKLYRGFAIGSAVALFAVLAFFIL